MKLEHWLALLVLVIISFFIGVFAAAAIINDAVKNAFEYYIDSHGSIQTDSHSQESENEKEYNPQGIPSGL